MGGGGIIGTSLSCGVDSLSTIYNHYAKEKDPDYKINALFLFDCGAYGHYRLPDTHQKYLYEYQSNKPMADELNLPIYQVISNIHAFPRSMEWGGHGFNAGAWGILATSSCMLSLQGTLKRYYIPSTLGYEEIKDFGKYYRDYDMAMFCESYLVPLLNTECLELIPDGCQYKRTQKTANIANWEIARKYLNLACKKDGINCGYCWKCMRTLATLEAIGKLEDFAPIFDLAAYRKYAFLNKCRIKCEAKSNPFAKDIVECYKSHNRPMPSVFLARVYLFVRSCASFVKRKILKI